jgi:hypothetical protein
MLTGLPMVCSAVGETLPPLRSSTVSPTAVEITEPETEGLNLIEDSIADSPTRPTLIFQWVGVSLTLTLRNALKGNDFYDGNPEKLAKCKAEDLRKINGLGIIGVIIIARAFERMGIIGDAEAWLGG